MPPESKTKKICLNINRFYGIPDKVKLCNNDNVLYYQYKLNQKSEFDFAIEQWTDNEPKMIGFINRFVHLNRMKNVKHKLYKLRWDEAHKPPEPTDYAVTRTDVYN